MIMIKDSNAISYKNILKGENMIIPFLSLSNTYAHILGCSWGLGSWKSRNFNIQCMWYEYPIKFCWKSELYKPKPFFLNQLFSESQFGFEVMLIILGHNLFWGETYPNLMYYFHNSFFIESVKNFNLYIKKKETNCQLKSSIMLTKKPPQNKQKNSAVVIVVHTELNQEL